MSVGTTPMWVFNFQLAISEDNYLAACWILVNQLAGHRGVAWKKYVTPIQAQALEAMALAILTHPDPSHEAKRLDKPSKPKLVMHGADDREAA